MHINTEDDSSQINFRKAARSNPIAIRIRLISLAIMLILVLFAMNEARKPETWARLGFGDLETDAKETDEQPTGKEPTASKGMEKPVVIQTVPRNNIADPPPGEPLPVPNEFVDDEELIGFDIEKINAEVDTVRIDFWGKCFESLTQSDRTTLFEILRLGRTQQVPEKKQWQRFQRVWSRVESYRARFNSLVLTKTGTLEAGGDDDRQLWYELLHRMKQIWNQQIEPSFDALGRGDTNPENAAVFSELQEILDPIAAKKIKDGTPSSNPDEVPIWIRWIEQVAQSDPVEDRKNATEVSHVELSTQPDRFRGKIVSFDGRVRGAQVIPVAKSDLGIEQYYLLWIQDSEGTSIPYSVYALHLPEGFPPVDWKLKEMDVPVAITAKFVKNRVYDSNKITRECPFLIAHTPVLVPVSQGASWAWNPTSSTMSLGIVLLIGIAAMFAYRIYRSTRNFRTRASAAPERIQATLSELEKDPNVMTPSERLRAFDPNADQALPE